MTSVRFNTSTGPSKQSLRTGICSTSSARSNTRRAAGYRSWRLRPIPGFCTPWPGNSSAIGPVSFTPTSDPGHQGRPPGQPRAEAGQQNVVPALDATLADRFLERQRNRGAGRVAVLVDVDRDSLERKPDAPRGSVDDAEVGLMWHPEVDVLEGHARGVADLIGLADEDVDRELEDIGADHVDVGRGVVGCVSALIDVAAGDLREAAPVRAYTPAPETGAGRCRPNHGRAGAVAEDDGSPAVVVVQHSRQHLGADHQHRVGALGGDI